MSNKIIKDEDNNEKKVPFFSKRSFKYSSLASLFTVFFIVIVVIINILFTALNSRVNLSLDLTNNKAYNLTSDTHKLLGSLKDNVKITVLANESDYLYGGSTDNAQSIRIMQLFPKTSSKVTIGYEDIQKNPAFTTKYPDLTMAYGDILVTASNGRSNVISYSTLLETTTDQTTGATTVTANDTEKDVDTAILAVTTSNFPKIVFTTGHSESGQGGVQSLLTTNNYQESTENLLTYNLTSDTDIVAIVDPATDFTTDEINKLDKFLINNGSYGKSVMVYFSPSEPPLKNLEAYCEEWGIKPEAGLIGDPNGTAQGTPFADSLNTDVITSTDTTVETALLNARPLTLLFDTKDDYTTNWIVKTSSTSQWENATNAAFSANNPVGPFITMAVSSKQGLQKKSYLLVSGSVDFSSTDVLSVTNLNNDKVIMDSVNYVVGNKNTMSISGKLSDNESMSLTAPQLSAFIWFAIILFPLAILILGLVIFLRRRHL